MASGGRSAQREEEPVVLELPRLVRRLPSPPPAALDPYLDAAARCLVRFGVQRTSVQDVAAELKVNRTTVYRQVGNVESMVRLLAARDLHRLLGDLPVLLSGAVTPEAIVAALAGAVTAAAAHPVVAKVLADEREILGQGLDDVDELLGRCATAVTPILNAGMASGHLARRDPVVVGEWLVRIGITVLLAPPPGELAAFLAELLVPALAPPQNPPEPPPDRRQARARTHRS